MAKRAEIMNIGLVALRFFAGSVIGLTGLYATLAGGGLTALIIPVTSFFLGGAVAGSGLRLGRRGALGFGVAFVLADVPAVLSVVATQAMPGPAMAAALVFFSGILFTVVCGIAGIVGLGIGGVADGNVLRGAAGGCCGGGRGGGVVCGLVLVHNLSAHGVERSVATGRHGNRASSQRKSRGQIGLRIRIRSKWPSNTACTRRGSRES